MEEKLKALKEQALPAISAAGDLTELEEIRLSVLGKKGQLTNVLRQMGSLPPEERPLGFSPGGAAAEAGPGESGCNLARAEAA